MSVRVRAIGINAEASAIRSIAALGRRERVRELALVAGCAAIDAVAAGILLLGTPLPPLLEGLAAAVAHGAAILLLSGSLAIARPSRRRLCVAAVLAVPCVGAAVAVATLVTRGRGAASTRRRRKPRRRPTVTIASMRHLRDSLSPCDALYSGDDEQRRAALSALSRRGDREAIALLRRAAAGRDPDLALSAALALDEISERGERRTPALDPAEVSVGPG